MTGHYAWVLRTRTTLIGLATAGIIAGLTLIGMGMRGDGRAGALPSLGIAGFTGTAVPAAVPTSASASASDGPDPAELGRRQRATRAAALNEALGAYAATAPEFSVAVLDRRTGERYTFRGREKYETASIVKVQVLACLLLKAQDADRDLTSTELALAKRMIRASDNEATTDLFDRVGRVAGVTRSNKRLGLTSTSVNSSWGLTRTTAEDQVRLLDKLADPKGPLDAASRKLAFSLMTTVEDDQNWGVSAAAGPTETTALKNGWLSRSTEGGRWIVNSVGWITDDDVDVSLAVLSHGSSSQQAGIDEVEKVAALTRKYLKY